MSKTIPYIEIPTFDEMHSDKWESAMHFSTSEVLTRQMAIKRSMERIFNELSEEGVDLTRPHESNNYQDKLEQDPIASLYHYMIGQFHMADVEHIQNIQHMPPEVLHTRYTELFSVFMHGFSVGWAWHHIKDQEAKENNS